MLTGFSWIVEPLGDDVVLAMEIPMGAAVAGPFHVAGPPRGADRQCPPPRTREGIADDNPLTGSDQGQTRVKPGSNRGQTTTASPAMHTNPCGAFVVRRVVTSRYSRIGAASPS